MNNRELGTLCENEVCRLLKEDGFTIIDRNFRSGKGPELDIIATKNSIIHFIEVKARSNERYGLPRESISESKMRKIIKASELFTAKHYTYDIERSYDVAEVFFKVMSEDPLELEFINFNMIYSVYYG